MVQEVQYLSNPVESLIGNHQKNKIIQHVDVLIIGSGYGGSVTAMKLAHPDRSVVVLERGNEYAPGNFPEQVANLPSHVRLQSHNQPEGIGYESALFDFRHGKGVDILVGNGLGGTSLINANVAIQPDSQLFRTAAWPRQFREAPDCLNRAYAEVARLLGVNPAPTHIVKDQSPEPVGKYSALTRLANSLPEDQVQSIQPAPVTVTFQESAPKQPVTNAVGIKQMPCTHCGNCVTGCNVSAKNTLATNLIPLAKARGARFYTGAKCLSVQPHSEGHGRWKVEIIRTQTGKTPLAGESYYLTADTVILAAGTLGSTEILKRSGELKLLRVSNQLGRHFSTNGDGIAFGFAQRNRVQGIGSQSQEMPPAAVGPTINGVLQLRPDNERPRITIEDGAVPQGLAGVYGELLLTGAQLHRIGDSRMPAGLDRNGYQEDPLAASRYALDHSQLLLVMGDDGAKGTLDFAAAESGADLRRQSIVPNWEHAASNPVSATVDGIFRDQSFEDGFDGGQYVPNPLWKLMPDSARQAMSGKFPTGRAVSVHPLGGCSMGNDVDHGVVNHVGQVFDPGGDSVESVYEGLHVLDGAILPSAVGVNPFLTISALSWRAAEQILRQRGWEESPVTRFDDADLLLNHLSTRHPPAAPTAKGVTVVELREQLVGQLDAMTPLPQWLEQYLTPEQAVRLQQHRGLILNLQATMNVDRWLQNPGEEPLLAKAELHCNPLEADELSWMQRVTVDGRTLSDATLIAKFTGTIKLLTRDEPRRFKKAVRTVGALLAYGFRRQCLTDYIFRNKAGEEKDASTEGPGWWQQAKGFITVAAMHSSYRTMTYQLQADNGDLILEGHKRLAFRLGEKSLWNSLVDLPIRLRKKGQKSAPHGSLRVNSIAMLDQMIPQIRAMANGPEMIQDLIRFGSFVGRALLQTHFWSFGSPAYPDSKPTPNRNGHPLQLPDGRTIQGEVNYLEVALFAAEDKNQETYRPRLTRYAQSASAPESQTILLVHGLAQGSRIFTTPSISTNMAAYFYLKGYDVWTLDYRLSNLLEPDYTFSGWSIDEIARFDIPEAVNFIADRVGQPIHLFAHCVGATAAAMAILKGWIDDSRIQSIVFNAIHPWIIPSAANRTKAKIGIMIKDWIGDDLLDPIPSKEDVTAVQLLDRLAFSVARLDEECADRHYPPGGHHLDDAICDRMTFLYGRMWRHARLDPRTHDEFTTLVGRAPGDVYRHLFYFAKRHHMTDRKGNNVYLNTDNIRRFHNIRTLFIHGEQSQVFNPYSAAVSASRFKSILPDGDIRLKRVPGYGHMDIIIARDAYRDVYPTLLDFFASGPADSPLFDPIRLSPHHQAISPFRFSAGPVLKSAERRGDKVMLRYWVEANDGGLEINPRIHLTVGDRGSKIAPVCPFDSEHPQISLYEFELTDEQLSFRHESDLPALIEPDLPSFPLPAQWSWIKRLRHEDRNEEFNFIAGSCRYPGTPFERDLSDRIFQAMMQQVETGNGPDKVFLIGDQIYADATANLFPAEAADERYAGRYREAFSSPNMARLLRSIPCHFTLDDHEFSDNWAGHHPGLKSDEVAVFKEAEVVAKRFMGGYRQGINTRLRHPPNLWYPLHCPDEVSCPAFIVDSRSERKARKAGDSGKADMFGAEQLKALQKWLLRSHEEHPQAPKFIFSGSTIAPIPKHLAEHPQHWRNQDNWLGYPKTLNSLIELITEHQIQNLVFVGGDLHLSCVSRLRLERNGFAPVQAWQLVSSGLYAPLPFANTPASGIDWAGETELALPHFEHCRVRAQSTLFSTHRSQFMQVSATKKRSDTWELDLSVVDQDGRRLASETPPHQWLQAGNGNNFSIALG